MAEPSTRINLGELVGAKFKIIRLLGEGAFGIVYEAEDTHLGRRVALKVIDTDRGIENLEQRFEREVEVVKALEHGNVVRLYDHGTLESGKLFMSMEFVDGCELREVIDEQAPIPLERTLDIVLQILDALVEAQSNGVVHRDLKPENILLTRKGVREDVVKLLDFGIAKSMNVQSTRLTSTGMSCGTPLYMAPEQFMAKDIGPHTDIYAVGLILLEMLTGESPITGDSVYAIIAQHMQEGIRIPTQVATTPLGPVLARALSKSWKRRFPDALSMYHALSSLADGKAVPPPAAAALRKPNRRKKKVPAFDASAPTMAELPSVLEQHDEVDTDIERFFETSIQPIRTDMMAAAAELGLDTDDDDLDLSTDDGDLGIESGEADLKPWVKDAVAGAMTDGDLPARTAPGARIGPPIAAPVRAAPERDIPISVQTPRLEPEPPRPAKPVEDSKSMPAAHVALMSGPGPRPIKRTSPIAVVLVLVILAGAAFALYEFVLKDTLDAPESAPNSAEKPAPETDPDPVQADVAVGSADVATAAAADLAQTDPPDASAQVDPTAVAVGVVLTLKPTKATVMLNGRRVCKRSPCELEWVPGSPGTIEVIKSGWKTTVVNLAEHDINAPIAVTLERQ